MRASQTAVPLFLFGKHWPYHLLLVMNICSVGSASESVNLLIGSFGRDDPAIFMGSRNEYRKNLLYQSRPDYVGVRQNPSPAADKPLPQGDIFRIMSKGQRGRLYWLQVHYNSICLRQSSNYCPRELPRSMRHLLRIEARLRNPSIWPGT